MNYENGGTVPYFLPPTSYLKTRRNIPPGFISLDAYSKDTISFFPIPFANASRVAIVGLHVPFSILLMLD